MSGELRASDFAAFFSAVHGQDRDGRPIEPFPWQVRLAERVCGANSGGGVGWPKQIALPTAAGKTACVDVAVFGLALQASLPAASRTAPRRIFFVVDRRVVVDQALRHSQRLAEKLATPDCGILHRVADALCAAGADPLRPLDVYALRGGMYRENAWVRSPLQPTVIAATVDQVGSRLLFRGYGVSEASRPLHAALVGNDALLLLDEAHCARPFGQTMALVQKYRGWVEEGEQPLPLPFHFVQLTATPSDEVAPGEVEHLEEPDRQHPVLGRRIAAAKPAKLVQVMAADGPAWINKLAQEAQRLREEGFRSVGVMVNRVATARRLAERLSGRGGAQGGDGAAEVVLLTGRMRPLDRDSATRRIEPLLSGSKTRPERPIYVVATQCLEVGADLDFDALVTECASLDALRQRFGRLNRTGERAARAAIVVRKDQLEDKLDPIYGSSLAQTWGWLTAHRDGEDADGSPWIDLGVRALDAKYDHTSPQERHLLAAPAVDAAVLLPAHLDAWCQTSPAPALDPDPAPFLHGLRRGAPEIQVVLRADLGDDESRWLEIVSLCPPSSAEALPVRLHDFRSWLRGEHTDGEAGDVEGGDELPEDDSGSGKPAPAARRALRWRGLREDRSKVIGATDTLTPGDVYVVQIADNAGLVQLGDFAAASPGDPGAPNDRGEDAFLQARDRALLRLTPAVRDCPPLDGAALGDEDLEDKLAGALTWLRAAEARKPEAEQRRWLFNSIEALSQPRNRTVSAHPLGGLVLEGKRRLHQFDPTFSEPEDSWQTSSDRRYPLDEHCRDVETRARQTAVNSGLASLACAISAASRLHDVGKADPRFQAWLHGGNRRRAALYPVALAKAIVAMPSPSERRVARERAGYPPGGRHELFSVRLAESGITWPGELGLRGQELVLHLIAVHHGNCRPLAPCILDPGAKTFTAEFEGAILRFAPEADTLSGHGLERLDSGVAQRFWTLTRRFGWWALAYIEAAVRLADWACPEAPGPEKALP
ncbi:MAG: type I-G CRISPR-associated helicase/endonuclease Cas3g [Terriglobales bacterium]